MTDDEHLQDMLVFDTLPEKARAVARECAQSFSAQAIKDLLAKYPEEAVYTFIRTKDKEVTAERSVA